MTESRKDIEAARMKRQLKQTASERYADHQVKGKARECCHDPRHETPCPLPCPACEEECRKR